jgi:hypothetical protein
MDRLGNTMVVNGESDLSLQARLAEVVRFQLTITATTRVFNVGMRGGVAEPAVDRPIRRCT